MKENIRIEYNGEYPNLCSGTLIVHIGKKKWIFERGCLCSGGNVWFDEDWCEHVEEGDWSINEYPEDFPEEYKEDLLNEINSTIPQGCCGGCV